MIKQKKFSAIIILSLLFNFLQYTNLLAICGCVTSTRESLEEQDADGVIGNFTETMHREYVFGGNGGYAGQAVFDLSEDEIRKVYAIIYTIPSSEFNQYSDDYDEGIRLLRSSKVINGNNYEIEKANLIFELDYNLRHRHEIYKYQEMLNELQFSCGDPDGIIGEKTKNAVKSFQLINSLEPDGILGPKTKNKLNTEYNKRMWDGKKIKRLPYLCYITYYERYYFAYTI